MKHKEILISMVVLALGLTLLVCCRQAGGNEQEVLTPEEMEARIQELERGRTFELAMPPLSLRLSPSEDPYTGIKGAELHKYLEDLTEFSRQSERDGNLLWGRVQGTKYERRAAEYVMNKFEEFGLKDVRMEEFPCVAPQWHPSELSLTLIGGSSPGAPKEDYVFKTAFAAFEPGVTPPEGIEAEVVYVGLGSPAELMGRDLEGKIALVYSQVYEGVHIHSARSVVPRLAEQGKALGVIVWLDLPGNGKYACRCGDGSENIPYLTVGYLDGLYLRKVIEASGLKSPPRVRMKVVGEMKKGLTSQNVVGMLPGTTDEYVIFTAHVDGYWLGTLDNGSGVAALLSLARHYSRMPAEKRRRNMLFLVAGDHEVPGAGGTVVFAKMHPDIIKKTAVVFQLEHISSTSLTEELGWYSLTNTENPRGLFVTNNSSLLLGFFKDAADRYGIVTSQGAYPNYWGDVVGFMETGVTCAGWIEATYYYHSALDSPAVVTPQGLERITRAYAYVVDKVEGVSREEIERGAITTPSLHYGSDMEKFIHSMW